MMAKAIALQSCPAATSLTSLASFCPCASSSSSSSSSSVRLSLQQHFDDGASNARQRREKFAVSSQSRENVLGNCLQQFRRAAHVSISVPKAGGPSSDWIEESSFFSGTEMKDDDVSTPMVWEASGEKQEEGIILSSGRAPLQTMSQDVAMGLVLRAASATGWTTDSGLEGPAVPKEDENGSSEEKLKFPYLSKSPRRKMRVAFTCNVCGERTTRAINPHAYTDGTVFVQCKGCDVFHKLVDNLHLFHEFNGKIYRGYDIPWYANDQPYDFFGGNYPLL